MILCSVYPVLSFLFILRLKIPSWSSDIAEVTRNSQTLYTFKPQFSAVEIVLAFARENAQ